MEEGLVQAGEVVVQEDVSDFRFLMISVLLSLDNNWMKNGVVPSLR